MKAETLKWIKRTSSLTTAREVERLVAERELLLGACKAQHEAIDVLFAWIISIDPKCFPSQSGKPWAAVLMGNAAIAFAEADESET